MAREARMLLAISGILFMVAVVEITSRINTPSEAQVTIDSYKFDPDWGHIHYCGGTC